MTQAEVISDQVAMNIAHVMAAANQEAFALGVNASESRISFSLVNTASGSVWRVSNGPREYVGRRGGGVIVEIDPETGSVTRVLRGQ